MAATMIDKLLISNAMINVTTEHSIHDDNDDSVLSSTNNIRYIAAAILFVLTLAVGTIPVYILEFSAKYFGQNDRSSSNDNNAEQAQDATRIKTTNSINNDHQSMSRSNDSKRSKMNKLSKWIYHDRIVHFLTQIGGGVLFYTAFIHMLPEIREHYESYLKEHGDDDHDNQTSISTTTAAAAAINILNNTLIKTLLSVNKTNSLIDDNRIIVGHGDNHGDGDDDDDDDNGLPLVDLCACAGLFGIFFLEELMHLLLDGHGHTHGHTHGHSHRDHLPNNQSNQSYRNINDDDENQNNGHQQIRQRLSSSLRKCIDNRNQHRHNGQNKYNLHIDEDHLVGSDSKESRLNDKNKSNLIAFSETQPINHPSSCHHQQQMAGYNTCQQQQCSHQSHIDDNTLQHMTEQQQSTIMMANDDLTMVNDDNVDNSNDDNSEKSIWPNIIDNFLLILAFSCHSLFDGISIGVQTSSDEIWTMLIAILSHKLLISFILSFQIYEKCQEKFSMEFIDDTTTTIRKSKSIKYSKFILWFFMTLFSLMSPIGILIVVLMNNLTETPKENSINIIVLAAISAGTILYIVFMEIIDKTISRLHLNGLVQWSALLIGFGLMHVISQLFHE